MIFGEDYTLTQGTLVAKCRSTHDYKYDTDLAQLTIGRTYEVEYAVISGSWTLVCLHEFPNELFNSALFDFYVNDNNFYLIEDYRAIKRIINDSHRVTTTIIYSSLTKIRISEIKERHSTTRVIIRSELLK